ncbi:MAG: hypothetical protein OEY33_08435, partial [Bdellovibrionales bacterium]|nr:hypothetical protein [Bdellovibrionales bacterium]
MGWNGKNSRDRIKERDFKSREISLKDLTKEMDLTNLGPKDVRRVNGAHIYIDTPNFHELVWKCRDDKSKQKKLIRALNTLQRVWSDICKDTDLVSIQIQSSRLHLICYKPYDNFSKIVEVAVSASLDFITYIYEIFNKSFGELDNFRCSAGVAFGEFLVCNIGAKGNRELLSIGSPANMGAKILNGSRNVTLTKEAYDLLPDDLKKLFSSKTIRGYKVYKLPSATWDNQSNEIRDKYCSNYNNDSLKGITEDYKASIKLDDIDIAGINEKICFDSLTEKNCKRFHSSNLFADLDGFTKLIQEAEDDAQVKELVRIFHGVRAELQSVIQDFSGTVVSHRGDCVIGTFSCPTGKEDKNSRIKNSIEAAIGINSSMVLLNEYFSEYKNLKIAIGMDEGLTIATRLGKQGQKENIIIGTSVIAAETVQQFYTEGDFTSISKNCFEKIEDENVKGYFDKKAEGHYSAKSLTFSKLNDETKKSASEGRRTASLGCGSIKVGSSKKPVK